jgi:hypothetical protein
VAAQIGFYESHRKGAHAEAVALSWLLNEGYFVFTNFAGRGPVDLVAVDSGTPNVILIDVKAVVHVRRSRQRRPKVGDLTQAGLEQIVVVGLVCCFGRIGAQNQCLKGITNGPESESKTKGNEC